MAHCLFLTWVRRILLCASDGKTFKGRGLEPEQGERTGSSASKGSRTGHAIAPVLQRRMLYERDSIRNGVFCSWRLA